jgi:NAD(P)-dependent dehydrogenase (short-subunit alcohol dehydrogenase family)
MKTILVTGASSGIGRATVRRLDRAGWKVFAGVRREEDAAALKAESSERLEPLILDVLDPDAIAAAAARIAAEPGGLDGLIPNAGSAFAGPLETLPLHLFREQLELNLTAQLATIQAVMPSIRKARGRIVLISSDGGRVALPYTGAYHASKYGIEAIGDALRQELAPWGIKVVLILPGAIDTEIWTRGEVIADKMYEESPLTRELYGSQTDKYREFIHKVAKDAIPADKVAAKVEVALEKRRPRARYMVGLDAHVVARLGPVIPPTVFDWVIAKTMGLPKPTDTGK